MMSEQAPSDNSHSRMIRQYTVLKGVSRWLLLAFIVFGILLTILSARSQRTPQSVLQEGRLGPSMAVLGKTIVLTSVRDNLQEILISTDSGIHFFRTGDRWPVVDTSLLLGISPDSSTIVAIDRKGLMRTMRIGGDHFIERRLPVADRDTVTGFVFRFEGDRIFVFGSFPMQVHRLADTAGYTTYNDSLRILSLASGPGDRLLGWVREARTGRAQLYFQTSTAAFQPFDEDHSIFPDSSRSRPQPIVNTKDDLRAADSAKTQSRGYKK
jgi:hypothetical protein